MIVQRLKFYLVFTVAAAFFIGGCSNTHHLSQGESLLHKNKIKVETEDVFVKKLISKSDFNDNLEVLYRQQPNRKILLFFKFKLWIYNQFIEKSDSSWWKRKVGEPPVIYDSSLANKTSRMMKNYLYNRGYFYADVKPVEITKNKRTTVSYDVIPGNLYTLRKINFSAPSNELNQIINQQSINSLLIPGNPYDIEVFQSERERIANDFKNDGYYNFNKEFVYFEWDSTENSKQVDIEIKVQQPADSSSFRIYYLNDIFILTGQPDKLYRDTIKTGGYTFIGPKNLYKHHIILNDIFLEKGTRYSQEKYRTTINRLGDIGIFKFVDVNLRPKDSDSSGNKLDCSILLVPAKKIEINYEGELSTGSESYLGTTGKITFRNKNMFNRADIFEWKLNGEVESQLINNQELVSSFDSIIRNINFGTQFNFYFPEFLGPKWWGFSKLFNPKTKISASNNFLQRVDLYNLNSINFSFGYDWKEFSFKRHMLNPVNINFVLVGKESDKFKEKLNSSPFLKNSFNNIVIVGTNYTFTFSNQEPNNFKNFIFFRGSADVAGLTMRTASALTHNMDFEKNSRYKVAGIDFAQFAKMDLEFRHYNVFSKYKTLVSRTALGIGSAYWNSTVMPYIKQFYVGGPQSIRAWHVRELGPGSYKDTARLTNFFSDQTGDMKIEGNIEYRFKIIGIFRGALFVDGGNIWTVRKSEGRAGASFSFKNFYKEIAISTGFGLRSDFSFFVLRLDFGLKFRDPTLDEKNRWVFEKLDLTYKPSRKDMIVMLAINYPF